MRLNRKNVYFAVASLCILLLIIYFQSTAPLDVRNRTNTLEQIDESIKSYYEDHRKCKLPNLPVDAPEIMRFIKDEPPIDCSSAEHDWIVVNGSECVLSQQAKTRYASGNKINCTFIDMLRVNDYSNQEGLVTHVRMTDTASYKLQKSDVVKVQCQMTGGREWRAILTGIRRDAAILGRTGWDRVPSDAMKLNVLMFGFDSLSRNNFIRKLPKSYEYLSRVLNAQVLEGYNIVGDGTPQALIPILTGQTELELPDTRKRIRGSSFVDVYPFVWKEFSKYGYVTAFVEDMANVGTFTYRLNGFKAPPTDHYMRPFYLASSPQWSRSPRLCYGSRPRHRLMLDYIKHMFDVYRDRPKFLFGFHGELSHDAYNLIGVADNDLLEFLRGLKESGALDNTLLIVMADHGHRFAQVRNTLQGKQEERLPFFAFIPPPSFAKTQPAAAAHLATNRRRLTTPFDIHATLSAVLGTNVLEKAPHLNRRSMSLWSEIPAGRGCADAYIEPHWCACLEWTQLPLNGSLALQLATTLINALNNLTNPHRSICRELSLFKLHWASRLLPNDQLLHFKKNADLDGFVPDLSAKTQPVSDLYQIKAELQPGHSLFEASIRRDNRNGQLHVRLEDISRTNMYGRQAACVENNLQDLRKYCYCVGTPPEYVPDPDAEPELEVSPATAH